MKFREYDGLTPKTIMADSPEELDRALQQLSDRYELVDLQFSASETFFTALALLKEKTCTE